MREEFLHYLWKHKKLSPGHLKTVQGKSVQILSAGIHNLNAGPDFFNAKVRIDNQLWAGNVEMHLRSSDWYLHAHQRDVSYDNVILHVVWEHDADIFHSDESQIPTLQLASYVDDGMLKNYYQLFTAQKNWIPCEKDIAGLDEFTMNNWLERLYIERLEQKSVLINQMLAVSHNDWEAVLFKILAKNFGLKVNGEAFLSMANSFDFSIVRKLQSDQQKLEALFFGQSGLLDPDVADSYFLSLREEYQFLRQKYKLTQASIQPKFGRLRPPNFPTVRLAQLASLYHTHHHLFSKVISLKFRQDFKQLFKVRVSNFWKKHYTFKTVSRKSNKGLSESFIDLLSINSLIPIRFCYAQILGQDVGDHTLSLAGKLPKEKNNIIQKFQSLGVKAKSALDSQALLELKHNYCDAKKCMDCAVGHHLLNRN